MAGPTTPKNIFLDWENWTFTGVTPTWDNGVLRWEGDYSGESSSMGMTYGGTVNAGDTLSFDGLVSEASNGSFDGILTTINGGDTGILPVTVGASFAYGEIELAASDAVSLAFVDSGGSPINFTTLAFWLGAADAPPAPDTGCNEIGRATRAYASAHQRTRNHLSMLNKGERRCLVADFNGALPLGAEIASAAWTVDGSAALTDQVAGTRSAKATISATDCGETGIECAVTLENGEIYIQRFLIQVFG